MKKMPHLQELKWDFRDNFKEATLDLAGNKAYYVYDASGNRVRKIVKKGSIIEDRIYIGNYEIYRKTTNGTLNVERETLHISDDKQRIATIDSDSTTTTIRYQLSDHLGSASVELDENADIISYEEYYPFGSTSYRSGRNEIDVSLKRYKYVMKELDNETGLYYYGMRYYASWICRFISVDPLQHKYPIYTPYQYAGNQPVTFIDLDGAEPHPPYEQLEAMGEYIVKPMLNKIYEELFEPKPVKTSAPKENKQTFINNRQPGDKRFGKPAIEQVVPDSFFHLHGETGDCWRASNLTMIDAGLGYLRKPTSAERKTYNDDPISAIENNPKYVMVNEELMYMDDVFYNYYSIQTYLDGGEDNKPNGVKLNKDATPKEGFDYINESLEAGFPVLVGITNTESYSSNENTDGTTNHFVVIVGRGIDENGDLFYRYFENGRNDGKSDKYKFFVHSDYTLRTQKESVGEGNKVSQVLKHYEGTGLNNQN